MEQYAPNKIRCLFHSEKHETSRSMCTKKHEKTLVFLRRIPATFPGTTTSHQQFQGCSVQARRWAGTEPGHHMAPGLDQKSMICLLKIIIVQSKTVELTFEYHFFCVFQVWAICHSKVQAVCRGSKRCPYQRFERSSELHFERHRAGLRDKSQRFGLWQGHTWWGDGCSFHFSMAHVPLEYPQRKLLLEKF